MWLIFSLPPDFEGIFPHGSGFAMFKENLVLLWWSTVTGVDFSGFVAWLSSYGSRSRTTKCCSTPAAFQFNVSDGAESLGVVTSL